MNKNKLFQWSVTAALAGFVFGFDTVVISGANLPVKELWHTTPLFHGFFIMSMALWGTLIGSMFGGILTETFGRKRLLLVGSIGYIISLIMVAWCFYAEASPTLLISFLLMFIASHALGQGAVIWVFISEIFPNKIRAAGQSFGASVHSIFAALITLITPVFLDDKQGIFKDKPWPIFAFFAAMMLLQLIWVLTKMLETKGISLEALEAKFSQENN